MSRLTLKRAEGFALRAAHDKGLTGEVHFSAWLSDKGSAPYADGTPGRFRVARVKLDLSDGTYGWRQSVLVTIESNGSATVKS